MFLELLEDGINQVPFNMAKRMTKSEIANLLEAFISEEKDFSFNVWDAFSTVRTGDLDREMARLEMIRIERDNPPDRPGHYCSQSGIDEIRQLIAKLRVGESK